MEEYGTLLKEAGFVDVVAEDRTWQVCASFFLTEIFYVQATPRTGVLYVSLLHIATSMPRSVPQIRICNQLERVADHSVQFEASLKRELAAAEAGKAAFVSEFSKADFAEVVGGWGAKLQRVADGEQRWGLFTARKAQ